LCAKAAPKGVDHGMFVQRLFDVCFRIHSVSIEEQDLRVLVEELRHAAMVETDSDDVKDIKDFWDSRLLLCSLFCLFCLFEAQPAHGRVVIRVDDHHFDVLESTIFFSFDNVMLIFWLLTRYCDEVKILLFLL
jgi:hypothetical protein